MLGTYDSSYAYPGAHRVEVNGTLGRAVIEDLVGRWELSTVGCEISEVWRAGLFNDDGRGFRTTFDRHVDDLIPALRAGQPPPIPAQAGRRALELALASIAAFETGRRVTV